MPISFYDLLHWAQQWPYQLQKALAVPHYVLPAVYTDEQQTQEMLDACWANLASLGDAMVRGEVAPFEAICLVERLLDNKNLSDNQFWKWLKLSQKWGKVVAQIGWNANWTWGVPADEPDVFRRELASNLFYSILENTTETPETLDKSRALAWATSYPWAFDVYLARTLLKDSWHPEVQPLLALPHSPGKQTINAFILMYLDLKWKPDDDPFYSIDVFDDFVRAHPRVYELTQTYVPVAMALRAIDPELGEDCIDNSVTDPIAEWVLTHFHGNPMVPSAIPLPTDLSP